MKKLGQILDETKHKDRPKNLYKEFQQYGVWLCEQLGDTKRYPLYIKLAQSVDRSLLEEALSFTKGYSTAKSKPRVFMWKLTELKKASKL